MSLLLRVTQWVSLINLLRLQVREVNGEQGLAADPHLRKVFGCGWHPITHPYHFAKPAPVSLET